MAASVKPLPEEVSDIVSDFGTRAHLIVEGNDDVSVLAHRTMELGVLSLAIDDLVRNIILAP